LDWATFIATLVKSLSWPTVILIIIVILKQEIRALVTNLGGRLKSAKGAGIELNFGERIDEVQKTLPPEDRAQMTVPSNKRLVDLNDLSALPPAYIVSQAWLTVEAAIQEAMLPIAAPHSRVRPLAAPELLRIARQQSLVTEDEVPSLEELRKLRNLAAHARDPDISLTDALRYNDIAAAVAEQIKARAARRGGLE
jgi:hypothetical protein